MTPAGYGTDDLGVNTEWLKANKHRGRKAFGCPGGVCGRAGSRRNVYQRARRLEVGIATHKPPDPSEQGEPSHSMANETRESPARAQSNSV
ncbi:unnamed protein product [Boreogadus saida]